MHRSFVSMGFAAVLALCPLARAQVGKTFVVYPDPGLASADVHGKPSVMYRVEVIQGEETAESFTCQLEADQRKDFRHNIVSFTTFSFSGQVKVRVTKLQGSIRTCKIYPSRYGITARKTAENQVEFDLVQPGQKMAVIFDDDWKTHPLLVFGDELEKDPPQDGDPDVIYFGPGVHRPDQIRIKSGQTLYLAGGAYVVGYVFEQDLRDVTVRGRGILSAEKWPRGGRRGTDTLRMEGDDCRNLRVEGITLAQSGHFACRLRGTDNVVRNIKVVGCWHPTTDGINTGRNGLAEDNFLKCMDDSIKMYDSGMIIRRNVFWQMENGACFQIGWGGNGGDRTGVQVYDNDIIRVEGTPEDHDRTNCAIISWVSGSARNTGWVFRNNRAENVNGPLIRINGRGSFADMTISDLWVNDWDTRFNNSLNSSTTNLIFEHFVLNGRTVSCAAEARITLGGARHVQFRGHRALVAPGADVECLSDRFSFTEGPAADAWGNVFFTDQPNNKIWKWSARDGELTVFHDASGRANGLYFDRAGDLLACADQDNELWVIDREGGTKVLVRQFDGKKLNGPNDLWGDSDGGFYFTDPFYQRPYWSRGPMEQDGQHVYYLSADRETVTRVIDDLKQPNGLVGTPDGKKLYVADIGDGKTYVYDIEGAGVLANKTLFAPMGSDGMTIDSRGNVYLTGRPGVTVFSPSGEKVQTIPIDAGWTANVCFGGRERDLLFITAKESVYTLKMRVRGVE